MVKAGWVEEKRGKLTLRGFPSRGRQAYNWLLSLHRCLLPSHKGGRREDDKVVQ